MKRPCDCDQSFEVHPPGYHDKGCAIWGPRYNLPDDYEFAFTNNRWVVGPWVVLAKVADVNFIPKYTRLS